MLFSLREQIYNSCYVGDHVTWDVYGNQYWPRDYLIDSQGYIRDNHIEKGGYDQTEKAIQSLLAERAAQMGMKR